MKITIEYSAQLAQVTKAPSEVLEFGDGATIRDACKRVCSLHGDRVWAFLFDGDGGMRAGLMICRNGAQVARDNAEALTDGDVVTLLTPISGG